MDDLDNRIWSISEIAAGQTAAPGWGTIQSYNPNDHTATVLLYHGPDVTTLTDELPIKTHGFRYAPTVGQMAFVVPESQDSQALVITGFAFNDSTRPPATNTAIGSAASLLNPGEFEVLGPNGSSHRFNADGSAYMGHATGLQIDSHTTNSGNLAVQGNHSVGTGATGSFSTPTGQIVTVMNGIITNIG